MASARRPVGHAPPGRMPERWSAESPPIRSTSGPSPGRAAAPARARTPAGCGRRAGAPSIRSSLPKNELGTSTVSAFRPIVTSPRERVRRRLDVRLARRRAPGAQGRAGEGSGDAVAVGQGQGHEQRRSRRDRHRHGHQPRGATTVTVSCGSVRTGQAWHRGVPPCMQCWYDEHRPSGPPITRLTPHFQPLRVISLTGH